MFLNRNGGAGRQFDRNGEQFFHFRGRRVVDDDVHVQPADAERIDRRAPRFAVFRFRPGARLTVHFERNVRPVDVRIRRLEVDLSGEGPVLQAQYGLHEARDPRRFQRVADVRFHAADRQFAAFRQLVFQGQSQRAEFRRVADLSRGRMAFDVLEVDRVDFRAIRAIDRMNLAFLARSPQALAATVGRHSHAADHRVDFVSVRERFRQRLQHDDGVAVRADESVGVGVKRPRTGVADRLSHREQHQPVPFAERRAADQRHIDIALAQRMGAGRHGDQRRRAGGVDRQVRSLQPEGVRDHARHHRRRQIGIAVRFPARLLAAEFLDDVAQRDLLHFRRQRSIGWIVRQMMGDFFEISRRGKIARQTASAGMADIHADVALREIERIITRMAASHRGDFAHDQMHAVVVFQNLIRQRADVPVDRPLGNDAADLGIAFADFPLLGVKIQFAVEARFRQLHNAALPVAHQPPVFVEIVRAGHPAPQSDHCQRNLRRSRLHYPCLES